MAFVSALISSTGRSHRLHTTTHQCDVWHPSISSFEKPHTEADIEKTGEQSRANNQRLDLTGMLMASGGLFYQVLEGACRGGRRSLCTHRR